MTPSSKPSAEPATDWSSPDQASPTKLADLDTLDRMRQARGDSAAVSRLAYRPRSPYAPAMAPTIGRPKPKPIPRLDPRPLEKRWSRCKRCQSPPEFDWLVEESWLGCDEVVTVVDVVVDVDVAVWPTRA